MKNGWKEGGKEKKKKRPCNCRSKCSFYTYVLKISIRSTGNQQGFTIPFKETVWWKQTFGYLCSSVFVSNICHCPVVRFNAYELLDFSSYFSVVSSIMKTTHHTHKNAISITAKVKFSVWLFYAWQWEFIKQNKHHIIGKYRASQNIFFNSSMDSCIL